ncbi:hypothetical protein KA005_04430 [bacterium]|nr:hypothetical protein [bacterium]
MDKFCVFCGKKPEEKSVEHILPVWLIELTGNPNRKAYFGYQFEKRPFPQERTFSFDSFKFPSCASCNQKYSALEATTKSIIEKMLVFDSLSATDINILLDWFDKVRVGLWLSFQYLDKNPAGITPKFYIEKRIGVNDRMLAIFKADTDKKGLTFVGCDFPSFTYTPSCFSIRINHLWFLNMSYNDLFSRRIGFPYPQESFTMPEQLELGHFTWGRNRIMPPLLKNRFTIQGTEIYQPMFRYRTKDHHAKELYDTRYVRENSMVWEEGIGKIFVQDNCKVHIYSTIPSKEYVPKVSYESPELTSKIAIQTLEWQQYIDRLAPSLKNLPIPERKNLYRHRTLVKELNKELLKLLLKKIGLK